MTQQESKQPDGPMKEAQESPLKTATAQQQPAQQTSQSQPPSKETVSPPSRPLAQQREVDPFEEAATQEPSQSYTVEDLNATRNNVHKMHHIKVTQPNGKVQLVPFTFQPGEKKEVSQDIALIFLEIDPSFRVRNRLGQIIRPKAAGGPGTRMVQVKVNEAVVPLSAVLQVHLFEMARALPGGKQRFRGKSQDFPKRDLEEFIITGGAVSDDADDEDLDTVNVA